MVEKKFCGSFDNPYAWEELLIGELLHSINELGEYCNLYTIEAKHRSGKTAFLDKLCNYFHKAFLNINKNNTLEAPSILYIGKDELANSWYKGIAKDNSPSISVYTETLTEDLIDKMPKIIKSTDAILVDDADMADNELLYQLTKIVHDQEYAIPLIMVGVTEQEARKNMGIDDKSTWIMLLNHPDVCNLGFNIKKESKDEKIPFDNEIVEKSLKDKKPDKKKTKDTASIDELLNAALSGQMKEFEETEQIKDAEAFRKLLGIDDDDPVDVSVINIDQDDVRDLIDFLKQFKRDDQ